MFKYMQNHSAVFFVISIFLILSSCATGIPGESLTQLDSLRKLNPVPELTPGEVVGIQLAALKANNSEDQGIAVAYRFSSLRNKELTGSFENYTLILKQDNFAPMLVNNGVDLGPQEIKGNTAVVAVRVRLIEGDTTGYIFLLTRQDRGDYRGSWLTDGVMQIGSREAPMIQAPETIDA
ncbi:MAG: hypothetical protein DRZ90_06790 [Spirochaetes bacterium]|nr:MAG: hypothetical protein DRZ90_06790 [Spirochaetota bacterium]